MSEVAKRSIFIQSCHASLEYDHARMFKHLGYRVFGEWDVGSKQRIKIFGITDYNSDIKGNYDLIVLHQIPKYVDFMKWLLEKGKKVVLISFGQTDTWQYEAISGLCRDFPNAYLAPYSTKEYRCYKEANCPDHKMKLLYFAKFLDDYQRWTGNDPVCYAACNSIHKRGKGCYWELLKEFRDRVPLVLSGKETEEVGGLGEIHETSMRTRLRNSSCFVSFGTSPATMVLTQIEAWCAGCPTVIYNNCHGLDEERMPLLFGKDVSEMVEHAKRLIGDADYRQSWHLKSLECASWFDVRRIGDEWVEFINRITK